MSRGNISGNWYVCNPGPSIIVFALAFNADGSVNVPGSITLTYRAVLLEVVKTDSDDASKPVSGALIAYTRLMAQHWLRGLTTGADACTFTSRRCLKTELTTLVQNTAATADLLTIPIIRMEIYLDARRNYLVETALPEGL